MNDKLKESQTLTDKYVYKDHKNNIIGPISWQEIYKLNQSGIIKDDTQLSKCNSDKWVSFKEENKSKNRIGCITLIVIMIIIGSILDKCSGANYRHNDDIPSIKEQNRIIEKSMRHMRGE